MDSGKSAESPKELAESEKDPCLKSSEAVTPTTILRSLIKKNTESKDENGKTNKQLNSNSSISKGSLEADLVGQVLQDSYAVMDVAGRGDYGIVFTAMDLAKDSTVAIKAPKTLEENQKEPFKQAAFQHGKLKHPNILKTWAYLESETGIPLLLMEHLEGISLAHLLDSLEQIDEEEMVAAILLQVCDALEYAHGMNITHGKLTPSNIFIMEEDSKLKIRVLDFAIAETLCRGANKTTNHYFSPEQIKGETTTPQSDIYSLGLIAYQMVTGRVPSEKNRIENSESPGDSIAAHCPKLGKVHELNEILQDALQPEPSYRLESVAVFKQEIEDWIESVRKMQSKFAPDTGVQPASAAVPTAPHDVRQQGPGPTKESGFQKARKQVTATINRLVSITRAAPTDKAKAVETATGSMIGQILLDSYAVLLVLAESPSTIVYLAKHVTSERLVRIKTVKSQSISKAFSEDVRSQARLKHHNIIEHLGYMESADGVPFAIMEHLDGIVLSELLSTCQRIEQEAELEGILVQVCDALSYAHDCGVVHGNLKPDSIFLSESEGSVIVKVLDFGSHVPKSELETESGKFDFNYLSPEQVFGDEPSPSSDIYSIGALACKLVTGAPPHTVDSLEELKNALTEKPISIGNHELRAAKELNQVLKKALMSEPENRYQSISDFKDAVGSWLGAAQTERMIENESSEKHRRTKEIVKSSIYNLVALRQQQHDQEQTVMMKFASSVAKKGPRKSPLKTALHLVTLIVVLGTMFLVASGYLLTHGDAASSAWVAASRSLSQLISRNSNDEAEFPQVETSPQPVNPKTTSSQPTSANQQPAVIPARQHRPAFRYEENQDYSRWMVNKHFGEKRRMNAETP